MESHETSSSLLDSELARLDTALRQLKVQYDMVFAGALAREPTELKNEVEAIIRRWSHASIPKYASRFRFNALAARYTTWSELWNRTRRSREQGGRGPAASADPAALREQLIARGRVSGSEADPEEIRRLHVRYCNARREAGIEGTPPSLEAFTRGVDARIRRLREERGYDPMIELRVVQQGDAVIVKARFGS